MNSLRFSSAVHHQSIRQVWLLLVSVGLGLFSPRILSQPVAAFVDDFESGSLNQWINTGTANFSVAAVTNAVPTNGASAAFYGSSAAIMHANLPYGLGFGDPNDSYRFSVWIFDWATNNSLRDIASVRVYSGGSYGSGSINQMLSIGIYNNTDIGVPNQRKYCGRIVTGTPSGWFNLTLAPDKTPGWHHFAIERGVNAAGQALYKFYQDDILGRVFTNTGVHALDVWDSITAGLGAGSTAGQAYFDGFEVVQGSAFIADEPQSQTNLVGSPAALTVGASGSADPLSYWWFKNGALVSDTDNISGSQTAALSFNSLELSDAGWYSVMVSNYWGSRTSAAPVRLEVGGIVITTQPTNWVVNLGSNNVSFICEAASVGNLTYQWKKDGSDISGANSTQYTIPTVESSDVAFHPGYTCVVSNDQGVSVISTPATLRSNAPPWIAPLSDVATNLGLAITLTVSATDDFSSLGLFQNFESSSPGSPVMFQAPGFSGTTTPYIDAAYCSGYATNSNLPPGNIGGGAGAYVVHLTFTNDVKLGWNRLTTYNYNPTVWFLGPLKFDVWTDRPMGISIGLSESNPSGAIGSNGGTSGNIENAGVYTSGSTPSCVYTNPGSVWTNLTFDLADTLWPADPDTGFAGWAESYVFSAGLVGGNGLLESSTGKGVLENIGLVPADGLGDYTIYLDNFQSVGPNAIRFNLDPPSPPDATIDPFTGVIHWTTPAVASTNLFTVRATDHLGLSSTRSFSVSAPGDQLRFNLVDGQLVLTWHDPTFWLESSLNPYGGFTPVNGATSPYTNTPAATGEYFRLHWQP